MAEDHWKKACINLMPGRPPWSPSLQDGMFMREFAGLALERNGAEPRLLVLGVTPEVIQLDWPLAAHVVAVDSSAAMIASTWRPHKSLRSSVVCARWQDMPVPSAAFDAVVGDGSLNALPSLDDYGPVLRQVARTLKPGGVFVLRCFVKPDDIETPEHVLAQARAGAFPTTAAFRMRFAFAVTGTDGSIGLAHMRGVFNALVPDRDDLAAATGWPRDHIDRVDADKDSGVKLTFPTQSQFVALAKPFFELESSMRGTYLLSDQCPTQLFRPRSVMA